MIDYEYKDLFLQDSVEKQLTISYGNTVITNEDLFMQEMTLEESLCSDQQLTFGSCEASVIKFKVANIVSPVKGQWITVNMKLEGSDGKSFSIGRYKVESDKPTADRKWREIVAYDALYDIINSDVIGWYNSVLPNTESSMTVKQFRKSFLEHFCIQEEDASLINDNVVIKRTVTAEELSGATVIKAICELNGCFGHIGRDGIFHYIHLTQGMQGIYPSNDLFPADNIYPHDPKTTPIPKNLYINCIYEDFTTDEIGKLQIVNGSTGVVSFVGNGENCYVIESNFLLSDKTKEELDDIGGRILRKIRGISYRPFDAECIGNPCFEVGDPVRLSTTYDIVETYILKRTLKGIQALKDSYSSDGVEKYEIKVNSTERAVSQINDNIDSIENDVETINEDIDSINNEIEDINENVGGLHISLQKTESGLQAEVSRAKTAEGDLASKITITESEITAEVTRAKSEENILSGRITLTAEQFQTSLANTAIGLQSQITQTADSITQSVSATYETKNNASNKYTSLSSSITQTASQIASKVSADDVTSIIEQNANLIRLKATGIVIDSTYFSVSENGWINAQGGKIGNFAISGGTLYGSPTTIADEFIITKYINANELGSDSGEELTISGGIRVRIGAGGSAGVAYDKNSYGKYHFRPGSTGDIDCGSTSYHWNNIYADNGTIQTSDRNEKMNIMDMSPYYAEQMIDGSVPKTYLMANGSSGRTHNGLIAQDVEQQIYSMGLTTKDFAGLIMYEKEVDGAKTGQIGYGLRYEEYIPIIIKYVQGLKRRLYESEIQAANMQNMFFNLQGEVSMMKQQLGGLI